MPRLVIGSVVESVIRIRQPNLPAARRSRENLPVSRVPAMILASRLGVLRCPGSAERRPPPGRRCYDGSA